MGEARTLDPDTILETLITSNVLETAEVGDTITVSDEFSALTDEWARIMRDGDTDSVYRMLSAATDDVDVDALVNDPNIDPTGLRIYAQYLALCDTASLDLTHEQRLRVLPVIGVFEDSSVPSSGVPNSFIPVDGSQLPRVLQTYSKAIVYIWLDECQDCDTMVERLDECLEDSPDEIALFAIYGPDSARLLHEKYGVPGGPTTLFVYDGTVDARLYGAEDETVIECQIQTLADL